MALANITIFIAQAAALIILIFAFVSYIVYKVRSRKAEPVLARTPVVTKVELRQNSREYEEAHDNYSGFHSAHSQVFAMVQASPAVNRRVTTDDLISMRVAKARDSGPKVVRSSYERPKEKVQIAQNWA